jgi:hypothetical protein
MNTHIHICSALLLLQVPEGSRERISTQSTCFSVSKHYTSGIQGSTTPQLTALPLSHSGASHTHADEVTLPEHLAHVELVLSSAATLHDTAQHDTAQHSTA